MEEVPGQEHHVDVLFAGQAHDLVKTLPAVVAAGGVALGVADMAVGGDEDADGVCGWEVLLAGVLETQDRA